MRFKVGVAVFVWTCTRVEAEWSPGFEEIPYGFQSFRGRSGQVVVGSYPMYDDKSLGSGAPAMKRTSKKTQSRDVRLFLEHAKDIAKAKRTKARGELAAIRYLT